MNQNVYFTIQTIESHIEWDSVFGIHRAVKDRVLQIPLAIRHEGHTKDNIFRTQAVSVHIERT